MLNDAMAIPTPVSSAPSASLANVGATGSTMPAAMKKASVATASATKPRVTRRAGSAGGGPRLIAADYPGDTEVIVARRRA